VAVVNEGGYGTASAPTLGAYSAAMKQPVRKRNPRLFWAFVILFAAVAPGMAAWFLLGADQPPQTKLLGASVFALAALWLIARSWWKFMR
jgi:hypothetical protein